MEPRLGLRIHQERRFKVVLNARRRTVSSSSDGDSERSDERSEPDELEPWPEFLKRTAQWTEEQLEQAVDSTCTMATETVDVGGQAV